MMDSMTLSRGNWILIKLNLNREILRWKISTRGGDERTISGYNILPSDSRRESHKLQKRGMPSNCWGCHIHQYTRRFTEIFENVDTSSFSLTFLCHSLKLSVQWNLLEVSICMMCELSWIIYKCCTPMFYLSESFALRFHCKAFDPWAFILKISAQLPIHSQPSWNKINHSGSR